MRQIFFSALVGILSLSSPFGHAQPAEDAEARGEYRVTTVRAAPGKWVAMKALIEGQGEAGAADGTDRIATYRMRHSQGAPWDFMLIQPIAGMQDYFSPDIQAREAEFRRAIAELADFEEDWFVEGPAHATLKDAYPKAGAFLIEMFRARAGMKHALTESRVKENQERILVASQFGQQAIQMILVSEPECCNAIRCTAVWRIRRGTPVYLPGHS